MKKYITPTSEIVSLAADQHLLTGSQTDTYSISTTSVGDEGQWTQKDDLDGDIDWNSED